MYKILNSFQLKIIAIITMTIDHIGLLWSIFPFRIIGRITFPIFAFLISQGAVYSKNIKQYFIRLFGFGLFLEILLQIINYFYNLNLVIPKNIFFTLSFGLLAIIIYKWDIKIITKLLLISILLFVSYYLNFDYSIYGILVILIFYIFRKSNLLVILSLIIINLLDWIITKDSFQMYSLLSLPLILSYNDKKGKSLKYLFYLYYPLHLVVIYIIYNILEH